MLKLFDKGQGEDFFKLWHSNLSETIRNEDPVAQKLEFYLNIYFAIYPLKYGKPVRKKSHGKTSVILRIFVPFYMYMLRVSNT